MIKPTLFSQHSLYALRFIIPPILMALFGKFLFETLVFDFPLLNNHVKTYLSTNHELISSNSLFHELKARLLWLSSVLLYFFVCIAFFSFLWNLLKKVTRSDLLTFLLISSSLSAIDIIYFLNVDPINSPTLNIFHFTFDSITAANLFSPDKLSIIHYILNIINFFAIIVVPFSVVTGCCIAKKDACDILQVNKQIGLLKEFVKGASAVMVAGIIHMQLWLYWPLSLMPDFTRIDELKNIISAIIQYWGISYSLTIAALYLPITIHLHKKVLGFCSTDNLIESQGDDQLPQNTKPSIQSAISHLPQIVAILGPMLVGTLSPTMINLFPN